MNKQQYWEERCKELQKYIEVNRLRANVVDAVSAIAWQQIAIERKLAKQES